MCQNNNSRIRNERSLNTHASIALSCDIPNFSRHAKCIRTNWPLIKFQFCYTEWTEIEFSQRWTLFFVVLRCSSLLLLYFASCSQETHRHVRADYVIESVVKCYAVRRFNWVWVTGSVLANYLFVCCDLNLEFEKKSARWKWMKEIHGAIRVVRGRKHRWHCVRVPIGMWQTTATRRRRQSRRIQRLSKWMWIFVAASSA